MEASDITGSPMMTDLPLELILEAMNIDLTIGITIVCTLYLSIHHHYFRSIIFTLQVGLIIAMYAF